MGKYALTRGVLFCLFLSGTRFVQAAKVVESLKPYGGYRIFEQGQDEQVCWALAAQSIILPIKKRVPQLCTVVGTTLGQNCCASRGQLLDSCNRGGHVDLALARYGVRYQVSMPNFVRAFETLRQGGLVALILNVSNSAFGSRLGHAAVIYAGDRFSDGSYRFYVGDSANGYYHFNTSDMTRMRNGHYGYQSLSLSFDLEQMVYANQ